MMPFVSFDEAIFCCKKWSIVQNFISLVRDDKRYIDFKIKARNFTAAFDRILEFLFK